MIAKNIDQIIEKDTSNKLIYIELAKSILNRSSTINVGKIMTRFGGGGHVGAGGCRISIEQADKAVQEIISIIKQTDQYST